MMSCCLDDEDSYFTAPNMVAQYSLATVLPPTGLHPVVIQNTTVMRTCRISFYTFRNQVYNREFFNTSSR